ncbi:MAG: polysaccharide deacetylase family protein [Ferruginibacter sp.]|nr:polysaccharide deacetylase family protein [Ferruginibacter sp.]
MNSDQSGYFNSSMLFKASILTLSFTAIYFYKTERQFNFMKMPVVKNDSVVTAAFKKAVVKKKRKTIYLTFDDGPDKGTKTVMDILKDEQIPATLFIIGEHVYGSRFQQQIYDSIKLCNYFEIANHSYTHALENRFNKFYNEPAVTVQDFQRCSDSMHFTTNIIRTPGRNIWRTANIYSTDIKTSSAAGDSLYNNGFTAIGWDVEWHYNSEQKLVQSNTEMINEIDSAFAYNKTKTTGHLVMLAHDRTFKTYDDSLSLRRFVTALKLKDEYDFEIVSRYPGLTKDTVSGK